MDSVSKYRMYCNDCASWKYVLKESTEAAPTACPDNPAHGILSGSISIIESISRGEYKSLPGIPQGGPKVTDRGFQFDAAANSETTHDYKFTEDIFVKDGELEVKDPDYTDYAYMALVDKDNILGYGAGFVIHEYVKDYPIDCRTNPSVTFIPNPAITEINGKDLYMRIKYYNHSGAAVRCKVRCNGYSN